MALKIFTGAKPFLKAEQSLLVLRKWRFVGGDAYPRWRLDGQGKRSSIRINVQKESLVIGIMSDSHDNCDAVQRAVRFFKDTRCELVIHAGDFVAPFAARELEHVLCPVKAVFGNCDGEKRGLEKTIQPFGEIKKAPLVFFHRDRTILITHIHVSVDKYAASRKYEIIVFGHTHEPEIREAHGTLLINPGETGGWISGKCSVALLDPATWEAKIVTL